MSKATRQQAEELRRLRERPETEIDTDDFPEGIEWSDARRSAFFRPIKKQ